MSNAKRGKSSSESAEPAESDQPAESAESATAADAETAEPLDPRERFRLALERKNATPGSHPGSQAAAGNQMKGSNGKRQRQFRRKSG